MDKFNFAKVQSENTPFSSNRNFSATQQNFARSTAGEFKVPNPKEAKFDSAKP